MLEVTATTTNRSDAGRTWVGVVGTGLLAALISLGRLWFGDRAAVTETLWAEDGLFPLCIRKADFFTCFSEPFAGYFVFLLRVIAWPISVLPWEYWALATNLIAAVFAGVIAASVVYVLRRFALSWYVAVAAGLLSVAAPMVGLETINTLGSSYILLLYLASLLVALPPAQLAGRGYLVFGAVVLLITALTIPSAVVVLVVLFIMVIRGAWNIRIGVVWSSALLVGLIVQAIVALNAESRRQISPGPQTLQSWADAIPISILTYWPGLSIGEYSFFDNFTLSPISVTGWFVAAVLFVLAVVLCVRCTDRLLAVGVLVLAGLGLGLIPTAIGFANNRYFVAPLLLWGAALLIALDPTIRRTRPWIMGLVTGVVLIIWWPAMPASTFRATPAPAWTDEVARVEAACRANPDFIDRPIFTPFWPPNWGDDLTEPTHPNLPCLIVWRWIGE